MIDLPLRIGMAAVAAWVLYTIFEIVLAAYKCWAFRRLLKQEKAFLDRWYDSAESREFEARYRAFKPAQVMKIELCDGSCITTDPEGQCESCADLEMREYLARST